MSARWTFVGLILALLCSGCSRTAEVNYRVTIEIDDNGTLRTGSGVWSDKITENNSPFNRGFDPKFRGEAIAVDFPGRPTLFVLPVYRDEKGMPGYYVEWIKDIFRDRLPEAAKKDNLEIIRELSRHEGWKYAFKCRGPLPRLEELRAPRGACPMFIVFGDVTVPSSAISIDPMSLTHFGKNVTVRQVVVTLTEDDVTTGLEQRLKWLPEYIQRGTALDGMTDGGAMYGNFLDMTASVFFSTELN